MKQDIRNQVKFYLSIAFMILNNVLCRKAKQFGVDWSLTYKHLEQESIQ